MKSKITKSLFILCILSIMVSSYGQIDSPDTHQPKLRKNAVYVVSVGFILAYYSYEAGIERMFFENQNLLFSTFWITANGGKFFNYFDYEDGGPYCTLGITTMTGSGKNHFEVNGGIAWMYNKFKYNDRLSEYNYNISSNVYETYQEPSKSEFRYFRPAGSMGYRYQDPGGYIIIRAGLGYPESLYFSFGICF